MDADLKTLHGGVSMTMAAVREVYWVPRLRQLCKKTIRTCFGCKRFQSIAFNNPPAGMLPRDRTEGERPFQVIGLDYAGPLRYRTSRGSEKKASILLITCSLTRAVNLDLVPDQTLNEFLICIKRFIAKRGRPDKIYSDNGSTFQAAAKWMKKVMKEESFHDYLAKNKIIWQFNLSRAPWWGGQFERMVGLMKQSLYKVIGSCMLTWSELEEVLLDVEITMNNRPLGYVENDVQMPLLTPNNMIHGIPIHTPEGDCDAIESNDLRRVAKRLKRCKDSVWTR